MSLIPVPIIQGFFNGNAPFLVGVALNIRTRIAHNFKNILPKLTKQKNIYIAF